MHQYLFYIGDFPVRMYGLVLCMAIFLATGTAYFLAKQDGRWHEHVLDIGIYGGFAGLIGGRLWDVFFFDWDYYSEHLMEIPFVWQGGMAVQGGHPVQHLLCLGYDLRADAVAPDECDLLIHDPVPPPSLAVASGRPRGLRP